MYRPHYLNKEYETIEYFDHNGYMPVQRRYETIKPTWRRKQPHEINRNYGWRRTR